MVEPVTAIIIAAYNVYSIVTGVIAVVNLFQKYFGKKSASINTELQSTTTTTITTTTYFSTARIIEATTKINHGNSKLKKNDISLSNPATSVAFILTIALVLAIVGFIIYRKHTKYKGNRFSFRESENEYEASPSPPTSPREQNRSTRHQTLDSI